MNKILVSIFAAGVLFAVGQALQCYKCDLGFGDLCITSKMTCNAGESCYSGVGKAAKLIDIKKKGCLALAECNKTTTVNFPASSNTSVYTMTKTCCSTDLCNGAPGLARLSSALPLALAALATLLTSRVLV